MRLTSPVALAGVLLCALPAFAQPEPLSRADRAALKSMTSFAIAELERGTQVEDPTQRLNAIENKKHILRMVQELTANKADLRARGLSPEIAAAGILFSDLGKNAAYLEAHAKKVFPELYVENPGLAKFKAFLLHEEPGIDKVRELARKTGLSERTTRRVVDAIVGHNGPSIEGSWWRENWEKLIEKHEGRANSELVGKPYPKTTSAEGALHAILDRVDQGGVSRGAKGWEGGPKKIHNDIKGAMGFHDAIREAIGGNPQKTIGQIEALRASHPGLFELPFVERGVGKLHTTMNLLNHVELVTNSQGKEVARIHSRGPQGQPVIREVATYEAFWSELSKIERPIVGAKAWTPEGRELLRRTKPVDRLARFRRADGTLDWSKLRRGALREAGGLAHFGLALFLKEVATVAATGDRARIEEFFEGLMTTDFYKHYGLFVAGARVGEVAYVRYLQRYVKPRFVNGVLKTNLILAAGMALPLIVEGRFEGKTFAISLASLGLSSAAVKAGAAGISWVLDLKKARDAGFLAKASRAGRLAKLGGWFYTVAELAIVLYVAEVVDTEVNEYLDERKARDELADASEALLAAVNDPEATPASLAEAAAAHHGAWNDYRNFLYRKLHQDEAIFAGRLEKVARRAKIKADERQAAVDRVGSRPALRRNVERRYGSLEGYADALLRRDEQLLGAQVQTYADSYNAARDAHLREVYEENQRGSGFLDDLDGRDWLLAGGRPGAAGDPWGSRNDPFARIGRDRARAALRSTLEGASGNRLEAYDDESALLNALAQRLRNQGREELAASLDAQREAVGRLARADRALSQGDGAITPELSGAAEGASSQVERLLGR